MGFFFHNTESPLFGELKIILENLYEFFQFNQFCYNIHKI